MERKVCKVLLVNPPNHGFYEDVPVHIINHAIPPIGLLSIASNLRMYDYDVKFIDLFIQDKPLDKLLNIIDEFKPDIIGITTYSLTIDVVEKLAKIIKEKINCYIFVGGPHATLDYKSLIKYDYFDFVLRNEGEFNVVYLLEYLNSQNKNIIKNIRGLTYKNEKGEVVNNPNYKFIEDLNVLPIPSYDLVGINDYISPLSFITSRGCPGGCIYCNSRVLSGVNYRSNSPEYVYGMIMSAWKRFKKPYFSLLEDTFTVDYERVNKFCELLMNSGVDFNWACFSRVDITNRNIFKIMKIAGCAGVNFGVESGSDSVLKLIRKGITLQQVKDVVEVTASLGMYINCSFIIGHYCDTEETVMKTINFAKMLKDEYGVNIGFTINTPFLGTYQYVHAKELGMIIDSKDKSKFSFDKSNISTKYLSENRINELLKEAQKLM